MVETVKNVLKRAVPQKVHSKVSMNRLKILVTTVNRAKADFYMDHIQSFGVNMQIRVLRPRNGSARNHDGNGACGF